MPTTEFDIEVSIDDDELIAAVAKNYRPDDVFPYIELSDWAEENGFVLEED